MSKDGHTSLTGRKIEVWWPGDERFYPGMVTGFQEGANLHRVLYADNEMENLDFSSVCWRFQDESASSTRSVNRAQTQSMEGARQDPSKVSCGGSVEFSMEAIYRERENISEIIQETSSLRPSRVVKSPKVITAKSEEALRGTAKRFPEDQEPGMTGQQEQKDTKSRVRPRHLILRDKEHISVSKCTKTPVFDAGTGASKRSNIVTNPPASSYSPATKKGNASIPSGSITKVRGSLPGNEKQQKSTKKPTGQKFGTLSGRARDGSKRDPSRTDQWSRAPSVSEPRTPKARSEPFMSNSQCGRAKAVDMTGGQGSNSTMETNPLSNKMDKGYVQPRDSAKMELRGSKKGQTRGTHLASVNADVLIGAGDGEFIGKPSKGAVDNRLPGPSGRSSTHSVPDLDPNYSGVVEIREKATLRVKGSGTFNLVKNVSPGLCAHVTLQVDTPANDGESVKEATELLPSVPSGPSGTRAYQQTSANIGSGRSVEGGRGKNAATGQPDSATQHGLWRDEVPAPYPILDPNLDLSFGEDVNLDARRKLLSRFQKGMRLQASSHVAHAETRRTGSKVPQLGDKAALGKRPRAESPTRAGKKVRRDDLDRVLLKLSENEEKQAARTDRVHSALVSGIETIRESVRSEEGPWREKQMRRMVRTLEDTFMEIIASKLNEQIAGLSKEIKEARKEFDTQLEVLGKEAKNTKDDLLFLKNEVEMCKESMKEQMSLLMKTLDEKLSVFVATETKHIAVSDGSNVHLSQRAPNRKLLAAPYSTKKHGQDQAPSPSDSLDVTDSPGSASGRNVPIPTHRLHEEWSKSLSLGREDGTQHFFLTNRALTGEANGLVQSVRQGDGHAFRNSATWGEKQIRCMYESRIKNQAKTIVAKAVTVWLLQTSHNCLTYNYNMWAQETSAKCLKWVATENLSRFESGEQALKILSLSLGYDIVETEWFTCRATSRNLNLARKNYDVWDPPPQDEEWATEEILLRELSERYFLADSSYTFDNPSKGVLEVAIEICRHAGSADMYKVILDGPASRSPER